MCCPEDERFNDFLASPHAYLLKICPSVKKITYLYQNTEVTSAKDLEESSIGLLPEWQSILEKFPQITFKKGNGCLSLHNNWLIHLNYHLTPYFNSDAVREYVLKEYQLDIVKTYRNSHPTAKIGIQKFIFNEYDPQLEFSAPNEKFLVFLVK